MLRIYLSILFLFGMGISSAQTKKIAYKSHSGNMRFFAKALAMNAGDMSCSSPGAAPEEYVEHARLDSVIYVNDTTSVMVTSRTFGRYRIQRSWVPGHETVYHHPLFSKKHELDKIK